MQYTWTSSRLWRKNRRRGLLCNGVDLNRNYNDRWGDVSGSCFACYILLPCYFYVHVTDVQGGSSGNECSDTYHGPSVESEPETKNTVNYFK